MEAQNKLISSFKALDYIKEDNLDNLSKIKQIKLSLQELLRNQKLEQDELRKKFEIQKINSNSRSQAFVKLFGMFDGIH